jgi:hypothetical protein
MKSLRYIFLAVITLLFVLSPIHAAETRGLSIVANDKATGQQGEVKLYNKTYAVIIGIDKYSKLPPGEQLSYAVRDAKGVEDVLRKKYRFDEIIPLYNEQATRDAILSTLMDLLPSKMTKEDALFVFWAGHGNQETNETGEIGYLIPYDGVPGKLYSNITMTQLKSDISINIPAKHVFYIMDACYSGLLTDTRAIDKSPQRDLAYMRELTKENVREVLTAGKKGQKVLDGGRNGHSVFTGRLIEALEARDDFITANEIQLIISERVYGDAQTQNHTQTPDFRKLYGTGDFVFIPSRDYQMQQLKAEQEQREMEIAKSRKEQDKLIKQMAEDDELLRKAKEENNARDIRKIEDARRAAEGKLAVERMRHQALEDEKRRKAQEEADLKKTDDDRNRRLEEFRQADAKFRQEDAQRQSELQRLEQEQIKKKQEEEQRTAEMRKVAEERRKKTLETATGSLSVDAAVAEIKAAYARIAEIMREFDTELGRQKASAEVRLKEKLAKLKLDYDQRIAALGQQKTVSIPKPAIAPKEEFETQAQYRERVAKAEGEYQQRLAEASSAGNKARLAEEDAYFQAVLKAEEQHRAERVGLEERTVRERDAQIKPFRERIASISSQEYTMLPGSLTLNLGQYDADKQLFPVSITSRVESSVKVAMNGTIPLPIDAARKFKQEWQGGLVRPEVTVRAGDGNVVRVALANDADGDLIAYQSGEFIVRAEKRRRVEEQERIKTEQERQKQDEEKKREEWRRQGLIDDPSNGLQWVRALDKPMTWNEANDYVHSLSVAGGGWRLPTRSELSGLYI